MFRCYNCGSTKAKDLFVNEVFQIDEKPIFVENIPAMACARCDDKTFSSETTEKIRQMVYSKAKPVKSIHMDVFTFV